MLIAWVWQDAIPSYEKATLPTRSVAFFMCVCAMCVIRIDRRRHPHRPTQTSASTDADIRTDRR
ncbi:hypothetical protein, partial [Leyella stercorea]|uniref:hypothetical protein n=1 Tax=Leyella stercorea TaxID=363265 RepID=UPI00242E756E